MALADFIPNLWAAAFLQHVEETGIYSQVVNRNYEARLRAEGGNTVKVPDFTKDVTIRDYVIGTDIEAPEAADGDTVDLVIDKQKYFNIGVDDVTATQSAPAILAEFVRRAARNAVLQIDSDIRDTVASAYDAGRSNGAKLALDANDPKTFKAVLRALIKMKRVMTVADIPLAGRWMIVHPQLVEMMENYFAVTGSGAVPAGAAAGATEEVQYTPATAEQTLRSGFSGSLCGFSMFQTKRVPTAGAGATKEWRSPIGWGRGAITHAGQISTVEALRSEVQFQDIVRGLYVYGTKVMLPDELYWLRYDDVEAS